MEKNKRKPRPDLVLRNLSNNPSKSPEARAKISAARKGKPTTGGRPLTETQKRNISLALKGRIIPAEWRAKISAGLKRIGHRPPVSILRGEDHPMWKGGASSFRSKVSRTQEYKDFVSWVLERDNYTCLDCGKRFDLQVHHVLSVGDRPDLLLEQENGATLCKGCHQARHRGVPRPNVLWMSSRLRACVSCGIEMPVALIRKYCPDCRVRFCCSRCGSTKCGHKERPR